MDRPGVLLQSVQRYGKTNTHGQEEQSEMGLPQAEALLVRV